jgi:adenylate kinase family enzyme
LGSNADVMKVAILGNSGSGKSTLARALAADAAIPMLDLDLVFWQPGTALERPRPERLAAVQRFCREHEAWIIEGCYADLIEASFPWEPELVFLDPGLEVCRENCRRRPHEPHKYPTPQAQAERLEFLLQWVAAYYERDDSMSWRAHQALFARYSGPKRRVVGQTSP